MTIKISESQRNPVQSQTRTYILAICLIGVSILLGGYLLDKALEQQERQAGLLNTAGAQRMLSQRMLALTFQAQDDLTQAQKQSNLTALRATYERMRRGHKFLTTHLQDGLAHSQTNVALSALYAPDGDNLDGRVKSLLSAIEALINELENGLPVSLADKGIFADEIFGPLLSDLDKAVTLYEASAKSKVLYAATIHKRSILLALVLLFLEALFVFRPLARQAAGQLKAAESIAQERMRLLSSGMQAANMGYWHYEVTRPGEVWLSEELARLYEMSDSQAWMPIEVLRSSTRAESDDGISLAARQCILTGEAQEVHARFSTATGRDLDTFTRIFSTLDAAGNVEAVTAVVRDTTEEMTAKRAAENAAAQLQKRSDDLAEAQQLGKTAMWRMPIGAKTLELSPEVYALLGYDFARQEEYESRIYDDSQDGTHLRALCVNDSYDKIVEAFRIVLSTGDIQTVDVTFRRGDGRLADVSVRIKLQSDSDGNPVALFGNIQDISDRREAERQLEQLAYYDHLTGLANRALCTRKLKKMCERPPKEAACTALVLLDLDNFKEVNDGLGHQAGDEFLCEVARRISQVAGPKNFTARLGGDEFAALITTQDTQESVEQLVSEMLQAISHPISLGSADAGGSASAGVCMIPTHTGQPDEALRFADLALYEAKEAGRNRVVVFEPEMSARLQSRLGMSRDLKAAIGTPALQTHYQPIVAGASGKVIGFETLMRWQHPDKGWISPAAFIPVAESSHLIGDIGEFALKDACEQAAKWAEHGQRFEVAVNVSAAQLWHGDLEPVVDKALQSSNLPPEQLCIELTESVFVGESVERIEAILRRLKARGIKLALDDFGTGYSSLGYLNNLPFDKLKIDRCFVSGADVFKERFQLLEGIVSLARGLNMEVVAEGIETQAELEIVRSLGVDGIQGFYFGKAEPPSAAMETADRLAQEANAARTPINQHSAIAS